MSTPVYTVQGLQQKSRFDDGGKNDIESMLGVIPSDDREIWLRIGMALKSELGNPGLTLFDQWSQTAANYSAKAVKDVWQSFREGGGITIGTIVYLARQYGWNPRMNTSPQVKTLANVVGQNAMPLLEKPSKSMSSKVAYATQLFLSSNRDDQYVGAHPYAKVKGIDRAAGAGRGLATGKLIGRSSDCIIVPIRNIRTDKVQGVECINGEGKKQTFGKKNGGALILGNSLDKTSPWYVVEGWASCVSTVLHHHQQVAVCSFGKASQGAVAESIADTYELDKVIILLELD